MIQKIPELLKKGTKFFKWHNEDNSTENRPHVGEIVKSFVHDMGEKARAIFITTIDSEEGKDLDVCSMEASVEFDDDGIVHDIGEMTGVAGASSKFERPAFAGAQRLAMIQCFGDNNKEREGMEITFSDVKNFVKERNVFPHQLYSLDEMKQDREFSPVIESYETKVSQLEGEKETMKKELDEKSGQLADLESVDLRRKAGETFRELIKDSTDKQRAYLERRFEKASLEDWSEQGVKEFIEASKAEFAEDAKLFGSEKTTEQPTNDESSEEADPVDAMFSEMTKG